MAVTNRDKINDETMDTDADTRDELREGNRDAQIEVTDTDADTRDIDDELRRMNDAFTEQLRAMQESIAGLNDKMETFAAMSVDNGLVFNNANVNDVDNDVDNDNDAVDRRSIRELDLSI